MRELSKQPKRESKAFGVMQRLCRLGNGAGDALKVIPSHRTSLISSLNYQMCSEKWGKSNQLSAPYALTPT